MHYYNDYLQNCSTVNIFFRFLINVNIYTDTGTQMYPKIVFKKAI